MNNALHMPQIWGAKIVRLMSIVAMGFFCCQVSKVTVGSGQCSKYGGPCHKGFVIDEMEEGGGDNKKATQVKSSDHSFAMGIS